jgi:hypothetical protein
MLVRTISECNDAWGWPTSGFGQSTSIPQDWYTWIIYPVLGLGVLLATDAGNTYRRGRSQRARSGVRSTASAACVEAVEVDETEMTQGRSGDRFDAVSAIGDRAVSFGIVAQIAVAASAAGMIVASATVKP